VVLFPHVSIRILLMFLHKVVSFPYILSMAKDAQTIKSYPDNRESILRAIYLKVSCVM
jgi:hypothetical protein